MSAAAASAKGTRTVVLVIKGTPADALEAAKARGLLPVEETVEDLGDGTCRVESPLQESALELAAKWLWETYYPPHKVGALLAIDADVRRAAAPAHPSDAQMVAAAQRRFARDEGDIEVDDGAKVSRADDNPEEGAYVQAWVWVPDADARPEGPA